MCYGCDTSYIVSVNIQFQASIYTLSLCRGHSWRVRLAKQETLTPPWHLVSPLVCRGPWMSTVVLYFWCHSDSASVLLYFTFLSHLFPLLCGAGSTVPREGFDSSVMPFSGVLWLWHFLYSVGQHPVSSINRSTEECSKLKSPETRQVQEILVSTLEHLQAPKWDRTRCPEE